MSLLDIAPSRRTTVRLAALGLAGVLLGACGARTPSGSAQGRRDDGGVVPRLDQRVNPVADTVPFPWTDRGLPPPPPPPPPVDIGLPPPPPPRDIGLPPPPPPPDIGIPSCLPLPASKINGSYKGSWKGTANIGGGTSFPVSGDLRLNLTPMSSSPNDFLVKGSLTIQGVPLATSATLDGVMKCTRAVMTFTTLGVKFNGDWFATFTATPRQGFANGNFKVSGNVFGISSTLVGAWFAFR